MAAFAAKEPLSLASIIGVLLPHVRALIASGATTRDIQAAFTANERVAG